MQTYFWLSGADGTMHVGGIGMGAQVCVIYGFFVLATAKYARGAKRTAPEAGCSGAAKCVQPTCTVLS